MVGNRLPIFVFCDWSAADPVQAAATRCFLRGQRPPRPSPRLQLARGGKRTGNRRSIANQRGLWLPPDKACGMAVYVDHVLVGGEPKQAAKHMRGLTGLLNMGRVQNTDRFLGTSHHVNFASHQAPDCDRHSCPAGTCSNGVAALQNRTRYQRSPDTG